MWTLLSSSSDFVGESLIRFGESTGLAGFFSAMGWGNIVMIGIAFFLLYLAIRHKFEPLLLLTIAFGMLLTNLPGANLYHTELFAGGHVHWDIFVAKAGLLDYLYLGVKLGIYPCLIFLGVGAMTDFGPLIANPKSFLLGAAAQIGIFVTFLGAYAIGFSPEQSGSIGIIGGADGPTAIYLTSMLAPELLGPIAVAAYSYMALVPVIQPPIMRLLTNKHERAIRMRTLRPVSKTERILFPIIISVVIALLLPSAMPLVGCLMLGNLMKECGVVDRLSKTVQNELMNIVVIFLGLTVGATATAEAFLNFRTLGILVLGVIAFCLGTAGGVLLAKFMNLFSKEENKINPLIGSAVVSAVPMAARVSQIEGQRENPGNYLLMHAMGPNVAGVVGSAVAAGILLSFLGEGNAPKREERGFRNPRSFLFIPAATPCATVRPVRASRRPPARADASADYGSSARRERRGRPDRSAPRDGRNAPAKPPDRPPATFRPPSGCRPRRQVPPHGRIREPARRRRRCADAAANRRERGRRNPARRRRTAG